MTLWTAREQAPARTLGEADFAVPIGDRYFEDYQEGAVYEYGYATVDGDELVAFARRFDPQSIHVDAHPVPRSRQEHEWQVE
jgi:acyl dehydratase